MYSWCAAVRKSIYLLQVLHVTALLLVLLYASVLFLLRFLPQILRLCTLHDILHGVSHLLFVLLCRWSPLLPT